jgi:hypothetical protein
VVPHKDELVGLTDGFAAERRELGVGDIEHVVVAESCLLSQVVTASDSSVGSFGKAAATVPASMASTSP